MNELLAVILSAVLVFAAGAMLFKRKQLFPESKEVNFLPFVVFIRLLDGMIAIVFVVGAIYLGIALVLLLVKWFG